MSITDKKGINVTSGFKLISPQPIDARMVVEDENELVSIVDSAAAYEGQLVYVKSLDKYVSFDGSQFNELETGGGGGAYVEGETLYLNAAESGSSSGSTGSGSGGSSAFSPYIIEISSDDLSSSPYYRGATTEEIEQITNNPFNVVFSITETALDNTPNYAQYGKYDNATSSHFYYLYRISSDDNTTFVFDVIQCILQNGSFIVVARRRINL